METARIDFQKYRPVNTRGIKVEILHLPPVSVPLPMSVTAGRLLCPDNANFHCACLRTEIFYGN